MSDDSSESRRANSTASRDGPLSNPHNVKGPGGNRGPSTTNGTPVHSTTNALQLPTVEVILTGTRPLLIHRGGLANPLDPHSQSIREISKKRTKTEADYAELARREWRGSLYYDPELGPVIPAEMLEACLVAGGKKHKLGTTLRAGAQVEESVLPIEYDGPRDLDTLEADERYRLDSVVKVGQAKTTRRRPRFPEWQIRATIVLDPTTVDVSSIELALATAGRLVGLGDWRPRFGRFDSKVAA